jgi:DNA invertase Pin-like site-specific DNA recombinase
MKIARVYQRVSTDEQDLTRQAAIEEAATAAGFYVAGVYREKASGARADRPELLRMIADLRPGEVVIAESIDRISRLPLEDAEKLVASIKRTGAKLSVPGVVDLTEIAAASDGVAKIVLESVQEMLLKVALQMARDDYDSRRERHRQATHARIIALRIAKHTIEETARLAGCSHSQVKRVWAMHRDRQTGVGPIGSL